MATAGAFSKRPYCRSRARFPSNARERAAAAFIVQCRQRGAAINYAQLVDLLNEYHPGLGRGRDGTWTRWLVRRVLLRAANQNPSLVRRARPALDG